MSQTVLPKLAYSIGELAAYGPVGRSTIYNAIAAGRLRARKIGRRTIVLDEGLAGFPDGRANSCAAQSTRPAR
jgi:excisionase family DNA binding protein